MRTLGQREKRVYRERQIETQVEKDSEKKRRKSKQNRGGMRRRRKMKKNKKKERYLPQHRGILLRMRLERRRDV